MDRDRSIVTRPGDWGRDIFQTERRFEAVQSGDWSRAVTLDSDGFVDCADVSFRWPLGWAAVVAYRVLLRIGTTLHLYATNLFPAAGPNVIQLGGELSGLLVRIRGIPHDGLIVETLLPPAAAAAGVATCHAKNWARSTGELHCDQLVCEVPQPLRVVGTVAIDPQPIEVFGEVAIVPQPIEVFGTVAIDPQPLEVFGSVAIDPQPIEVFGSVAAVPPVNQFNAWGALAPSKVARIGPALLQGFSVHNPGPLSYLFTFNAAAVPAPGATSLLVPIELPANDNLTIALPNILFAVGITWAISTQDATLLNPAGPNLRTARVDTFWRLP